MQLLALLDLIEQWIGSDCLIIDSHLQLLQLVNLNLLELLLHFFLPLNFSLLPLLFLLLPLFFLPLSLLFLLLDSLLPLLPLLLFPVPFLLSFLQQLLHSLHPLDIVDQLLLLLPVDEVTEVFLSEFFFLLEQLVFFIACFLALLIDLIEFLREYLVRLFFLGLHFFELFNFFV